MVEFLLILHFFGLAMMFASFLGSFIVGLVINESPPSDAPVLARSGPRFRWMGQIGLALLIVTGPLLLWLKWNGTPPDWTWFGLKIAFVLVLVAVVVLMDVTGRKAQSGADRALAGRLPVYRRIATTFLMLIVVFAVLAFD